MSRSYKRTPSFTLNKSKYHKRLVHRINRHKFDLPNGSYYKYCVNPWDICDYKWLYFTYKDFENYLRYAGINKLYKLWMK